MTPTSMSRTQVHAFLASTLRPVIVAIGLAGAAGLQAAPLLAGRLEGAPPVVVNGNDTFELDISHWPYYDIAIEVDDTATLDIYGSERFESSDIQLAGQSATYLHGHFDGSLDVRARDEASFVVDGLVTGADSGIRLDDSSHMQVFGRVSVSEISSLTLHDDSRLDIEALGHVGMGGDSTLYLHERSTVDVRGRLAMPALEMYDEASLRIRAGSSVDFTYVALAGGTLGVELHPLLEALDTAVFLMGGTLDLFWDPALYLPRAGDHLDLFRSYTPFTGEFAALTLGQLPPGLKWTTSIVSAPDGYSVYRVSFVPEPSAFALLLLALGVSAGLRRRRAMRNRAGLRIASRLPGHAGVTHSRSAGLR